MWLMIGRMVSDWDYGEYTETSDINPESVTCSPELNRMSSREICVEIDEIFQSSNLQTKCEILS